jgi:hypothetical protein
VGIKPKSMVLDDGLSSEVEAGVRKLAEAIIEAAGG